MPFSPARLPAPHHVGSCGQKRVGERGGHVQHQIVARLGQLLGQELDRVDTWRSDHEGALLRGGWERSLEGSTGGGLR